MSMRTRPIAHLCAAGIALALGAVACGRLGTGRGSSGGSAASFGSMTGQLAFTPPLADARIASVDALGPGGTTTPGTVSPNGDFVIYPLVAGTYTLTAECPGYTASPIIGIGITDGADTQAPAVLQMTGTVDAGP